LPAIRRFITVPRLFVAAIGDLKSPTRFIVRHSDQVGLQEQ